MYCCVIGADFHPHGTHLATGSGDQSVKLWDFASASCTATLVDHTQAVWGVAFHYRCGGTELYII